MTQSLIHQPQPARELSARISAEVAQRVSHATTAGTKRAYRADWADFELWCGGVGRASLPATPETVAEYVNHLANLGAKHSTLKRRIVSIAAAHQTSGHDTPTSSMLVRKAMQGIRRDIGASVTKKHAITIPELHAMIDATPDDLRGLRDKAILTLHFAGAFRRSEVCNLNHEDVRISDDEIVVILRTSKTDQDKRGQTKRLSASELRAIDPVTNLRAWLRASGIKNGALFRRVDQHGAGRHKLSGESIAQVWKGAAKRAGLDADEIAGHSARRGFITAAYEAELTEADIMAHTGHKSPQVMRGYREDSGAASRKVSRAVMNG